MGRESNIQEDKKQKKKTNCRALVSRCDGLENYMA